MKVKDIDLKKINSFNELIQAFSGTGFQAGELSKAVELIEKMKKEKSEIILSFTANMVASGLRGIIKELCEKKFVSAIVTTAGSIDHDIIKSLTDYESGEFFCDDIELNKKGINRIGNILIHNKGFEELEKKIIPIYEKIYSGKKIVSPRELIKEIGMHLKEDSFLYWCSKNNIPVFCPGITDGAIGLQMYFFKQDHTDFGIDVTADMKELGNLVLNADKCSAIILGGGISKHHVIGANLLRNGLDYAVYVSTASEFDGSLSGARTHEAKSWGKIKGKASTVNVYGEATIVFPLIAKALQEKKLI
ncbi:MAG: deoxyhypusine synthase [Candidatus Diapherotrites archaeon]